MTFQYLIHKWVTQELLFSFHFFPHKPLFRHQKMSRFKCLLRKVGTEKKRIEQNKHNNRSFLPTNHIFLFGVVMTTSGGEDAGGTGEAEKL